MKVRVLTGAVILILTVGFVLLKQFSPFIFDAFLLVIMYGIIYETTKAYKLAGKKVDPVVLYCFPAFIMVAAVETKGTNAVQNPLIYLLFMILFALVVLVIEDFVAEAKRKPEEKSTAKLFEITINTMSALVYPVLVFGFMFILNHVEYNFSYMGIIMSFAIAMLTDTCAYMFGRAFGKHKLIPEVSPKKTIEGAIGGIFGGLIGAAACFFTFYYTSWFNLSQVVGLGEGIAIFLSIGVICSVLDQIGDLIESAFKRKVGIKDLGKIFPGHGGFMDRVDGLMFTSMGVYLLLVIFLFH